MLKNNICIGERAGDHITDEDNQFCFSVQIYDPKMVKRLSEFRTTMTQKEYKVVYAVVMRALSGGAYRKESICA